MTMHIQGMGWVTPLGNGLDEAWERLMNGERSETKEISSPHSKRTHHFIPVPPKQVEVVGKNPRLRRSSAISYLTATAGLAALENAALKMTPEIASRTALVFSISSGGVVYTRRFYEPIVMQGAAAASPLLFPETVYNAPASHLAALLGVTGATYTVVGDASVGISAIQLAEQLLDTTDIDHCLVVGGEEVDWVLCEAHREWRLITTEDHWNVCEQTPRGAMLAEGAAALVLSRSGGAAIARTHPGVPFFKRTEAPAAIARVVHALAQNAIALAVGSANGTFVDAAERHALHRYLPDIPAYHPKEAFGESLGAGSIMQVIVAALALARREAPHGILLPRDRDVSALVSCCGWNHQASGLVLNSGG